MKPRQKTPIDYILPVIFLIAFYVIVIHGINAFDNSLNDNGKVDIQVMLQLFQENIETGIFQFENTPSLKSGLLCATLAAILFIIYQADAAKKKRLPGKEYGSADWSNPSELVKKQEKQFEKNIILSQNVRYSFNNEKTHLNMNTMVLSLSGGGKSYNVFLPNILNCYGCYIIVDPKLELVKQTGTSLKKNKYNIKVYNTDDLENSNCYNPLHYIEKEDDIIFMVKTILMNTKADPNATGGDGFWEDAAELLMLSLISYAYYEFPENKRNIPEIIELMEEAKEMQEEDAGDQELTALDNRMLKLESEIKQKKEKNPDKACPEEVVIKLYKKFQIAPKKTAMSILISVASRLKFFDVESVRKASLSDEMELNKIGNEKIAIFIGIPPTDTSKQFLTAMMFTQIFKIIERNAKEQKDGKLKVTTRIMIDEAKNVGKIPNLPEVIAYVRGLNAGVTLAYQDKSQIDAAYKDDAKAILGNCSSTVFLKGDEPETTKYISDKLGNTTIYTTNRGRTYGRNASHSDNEQGMARKLLEPDEVASINDDECIVFVEGKKFFDKKYNTKKHPNYKNSSRYKPTLIEKIKGFKVNDPFDYKEEIIKNRKKKEFIERKREEHKKIAHSGQDDENMSTENSNMQYEKETKQLEKHLQEELKKFEYKSEISSNSPKEDSFTSSGSDVTKAMAKALQEDVRIKVLELKENMQNIELEGLDLSLLGITDEHNKFDEEMEHIIQQEAEKIVTLSYEELSEENKKMYRQSHEAYLKEKEIQAQKVLFERNKKEEVPKELAKRMAKQTSEMQEKYIDTITVISKEQINSIGKDDENEEFNEDEIEEIFEEIEEELEII